MPHSSAVPRLGVVAAALAAAASLGACGSVRTELPASVVPAPPLQTVPPVADGLVTTPAGAVTTGGPATTASAYLSPGMKHPLPGGTLAASYPRVGVRPPRGVAPPPAGQAWAVLNVRFCAGAESPIDGSLVDPDRFRVEVPGQGYVGPAADAPALAPGPLVAGTGVAASTCVEGSVAYLVAGEGHIESITYDSGAGLLRWAT